MEYLIDVEGKRLVSSISSTRTVVPEPFVFGDEPDISVTLLEESNNATSPWTVSDLTGYSIRVGVGVPGAQPTAGNYTLTFGADTTSSIAWDADATAIDTALNALASITAAGGVTVTALPLGFQIKFDSVGAQASITATTDALYPSTSAYIYEATEGDGSTQEVQVFTLEQNNAAYAELTTDTSSVSTTVTTVREGVTDSIAEIQKVAFFGSRASGTYQITVAGEETDPIAHDATSTEIRTAIEALTAVGAGKVTVYKTGSPTVESLTITLSPSLGNVATISVDTSNMGVGSGKSGTISFNTTEFLELLDGNQQVSAILEVVKYNTSTTKSETVLQQPILCRQDVVANLPASTTPLPTYASATHTHTESDITDLGTTVTLNADTNISGNAWFLDEDTMVSDDAEKVPSQQSVKAYVDSQVSALGSVMDFRGDYDASTTDPTDGGVGDTYVVTVAGTGVASFWTNTLEVGDVIIQKNATATTEADWVVVSRDLIPATETTAGVVELATQAEVDTGTDTTRAITPATLASYSGLAGVTATETVEGNVELATQAEVEAADDTAGDQVVRAKHLLIKKEGTNTLTIGDLSGNAGGNDSITIQSNNITVTDVASGTNAVSIGNDSLASGGQSLAIGGFGAEATAQDAVAVGTTSLASGANASAVGKDSEASGTDSTGIGTGATASAANATAIGSDSTASGTEGTAIGAFVNNTKAYCAEFGSWLNTTTRSAGVRCDSTGQVGISLRNSATAPLDGGAVDGAEDTGDLGYDMYAIRRDNNDIYIDDNRAGTVTSTLLSYDLALDSTPELGGNLNIGVYSISSSPGVDINITPGTTGNVVLRNYEFDVDQAVGTTQNGMPLVYDNATGEISLGIAGAADSATGDGTTTIDWGVCNTFAFQFLDNTNETFTFTDPPNPCTMVLKLTKGATTGTETATWPASVKWSGGTAPTLSTGTSDVDVIRFYFDGTNYYGTYDLNFS